MTMKKKLLTTLSVVLILGLAALGILAYLTDTDSDVNVMTLGNVSIEQNEYQRVVNDDGTYPIQKIDGIDSYKLEAFEQAKPLLPIVGDPNGVPDGSGWPTAGWDNTVVRMTQVDSYGYMQVFAGKNAQDKFVVVENTGKTDAYVRTLVAIEVGSGNPALIGTSYHGNWSKNEIGKVTIDDNDYNVFEYVYKGASDNSRHVNGILPAGDTAYPNLSQVYIKSVATNEDCAAIDGNGNGTLDILVLSQAVQAEGFDNAAAALTAGFGEANKANVQKWFGGMSIPPEVATVDELKAALAAGGTIVLKNDITADGTASLEVPAGVTVTLNLNGKTLTNAVSGAPALLNNGTLTIKGEGAIVNGTNSTKKSHTVRNYGTLTIESGNIGTDDTAGAAVINDGTATINGGIFASKQENVKSDGLCAYVFINNGAGTMTINDATFNGQTHGLFGAYNGELIVNGGSYTMDGNGGLGCYVVYSTGTGKVTLNGGVIYTNSPRNGNVFFVYDNGNYFNADAVTKGKVVVNDGVTIYKDGVEQNY